MQSASVLDRHRQALGILFVVFSALLALVALGVLAVFVLGVRSASDQGGRAMAVVMGIAVTAFLLLLSLPGLIGGLGMLRRRAWSKVVTLIVAVLSLPSFPLGTVLGIYAIWFWLQPNSSRLFFPQGQEPRGPELGGPGIRRPLIT
jgi:hypothetical protein